MRYKTVLLMLLMALLILGTMPVAYAVEDKDGASNNEAVTAFKIDNREDPLTMKQLELKEKAVEARLNGKTAGKVVEVAKGQFVELERQGEGAIWTVLGEFPDLKHNTISEPDRAVDNTTIWSPDFSRDYYMDLLFNDAKGANSMRNYYIEQSSNRYTVYGDVTNWIEVSNPAATYDDDISGPAVWGFLQESADGWYASQIYSGKTPAEINDYLSQFDVWDRYDYDGDGNFDERDGYIDTFQSVHAGEGEEAGGGSLGTDAIWSHSWYAYSSLMGVAGPDFNKLGGIQIGNSDYWVGKYTIQPENGGVGVFAHEFGHDLGLPDLYDTSDIQSAENGTGFWTLMSSGSWLGDGTEDIGSKPGHMGAWEKFQLGWLNYEVARAGEKSVHRLGPMEFNTKQAQGVFVILPKKEVVTNISTPFEGDYFYYSGSGDNLDNFMYKEIPSSSGEIITAKVKYDIELDWDYAYLVVSYDNGSTWIPLETNLSTSDDPNGQNFGHGITGTSGGHWTTLTATIPTEPDPFLIGFRYWTDVAVAEPGFMVDNIQINGFDVDGSEEDAGWTFDGFSVTEGYEIALFNHYYVCEYRTYLGYDSVLQTGPYNFGFLDNPLLGNYVEHFSYQDGLLINYWDTSQSNNQVGRHPGQGLLLPVDAHPTALIRPDGGVWRNRIQTYDSTFTISPTESYTLHWLSQPGLIPSLPGVSVFDDRNSYYDPVNPWGSVIVPNTGTTIKVLQEPYLKVRTNQAPFMQIQISPAK